MPHDFHTTNARPVGNDPTKETGPPSPPRPSHLTREPRPSKQQYAERQHAIKRRRQNTLGVPLPQLHDALDLLLRMHPDRPLESLTRFRAATELKILNSDAECRAITNLSDAVFEHIKELHMTRTTAPKKTNEEEER